MSSSLPPLPPIRVVLPDGQELRGLLHARQQFPQGGWMYWVGLPMWRNVSETEGVEASEYRVWLTAEQAKPISGVSYDKVATHRLARGEPTAQAGERWAWKFARTRPAKGKPSIVVHVSDCDEAPSDGEELSLFEALEAVQRGAVLCSECGADAALGPLA